VRAADRADLVGEPLARDGDGEPVPGCAAGEDSSGAVRHDRALTT